MDAGGREARAVATPRCSLIIPMYRESGRISRSIERLVGSDLDDDDIELIFVDDGSVDGTFERVEALVDEHGLNARVIRLPVNRGKGGAIAAGVTASRGQRIAFTDADLSTAVADIVRCFAVIGSGQADVVVGSRAHPESVVSTEGPTLRPLLGRTYNRLLRLLGLTDLRDTQCGLKGFTRQAAKAAFDDLRTPGFAFDIEVLARAALLDLRIVEIPVQWEHVPRSRVRPVRDAVVMSRDAVRVRRLIRGLASTEDPLVAAALAHEHGAGSRVPTP